MELPAKRTPRGRGRAALVPYGDYFETVIHLKAM